LHIALKEIVLKSNIDKTFLTVLQNMFYIFTMQSYSLFQSGKIAQHLELVSHQIRERLDEIKRQEMQRLRELTKEKMRQMNGMDVLDSVARIPGMRP